MVLYIWLAFIREKTYIVIIFLLVHPASFSVGGGTGIAEVFREEMTCEDLVAVWGMIINT